MPLGSMETAYDRGKELADESWQDIVWQNMIPQRYFQDAVLNLFFRCGREGARMPEWVSGWRYGEIPACGRSFNYRDGHCEDGVSIMEVDSQEEQIKDQISTMFIAAQGRKKVKVAGWLNPLATGSDGEPLIVGAVEIK